MNNTKTMLSEILFITNDPLVRIAERSKIPLATLYDLLSGRSKQPQGKTIYRLFWLYCTVITEARLRNSCRRYYPALSTPVYEARKSPHLSE